MKIYKDMVAIPPGETIKDELIYASMTQSEFAKRMGMSEKAISQIINGEATLSYETALKLESVLGIPASMWNNLEAQYREVLVRIEEEEGLEEEWNICYKLPIKEMVNRGWINSFKEKSEIIREVKNFFSVASLKFLAKVEEKFFTLYENEAVLFRKNETKEICEFSMVSWIREGEIEANKINTENFSKESLKKAIPEMKKLSTINSHESIERLKEICRQNGVALVILPHLPKTYVNGVSKWIGKEKALIILSNKGKKIDAFWFNFFHELGHILHHSKKEIFVNAHETLSLEIEEEANKFAKDILVPKKEYKAIYNIAHTKERLIELGEKLGVHPSIILGVLQYDKIIEYRTNLNNLKEDIIL